VLFEAGGTLQVVVALQLRKLNTSCHYHVFSPPNPQEAGSSIDISGA